MTNPLIKLPLNTKKVYVMAKTHDGCEVYMPVDSINDDIINAKKSQLQEWLNGYPLEPLLA